MPEGQIIPKVHGECDLLIVELERVGLMELGAACAMRLYKERPGEARLGAAAWRICEIFAQKGFLG